ncbi:MAG TPA: hypothetical protein VKE51_20670 [Vicinamibacterales bacterium]|nr:hypothetical protein [Vicinamibacterales bacterium]
MRANQFLVDGFPVSDLQNRASTNPTIEAIQDMKVQLHTYATQATLYLDKNAFTTTPVNRFADTPRILPGIYSPWRNNVDLGIRKNVRTGGGTSASINIEVLNMFNIVQWAAMASSQFGNSSFGQITNQANNMRMVQFTVRFQF